MNDQELQQLYARILQREPTGREACVSPEELLALAEGRLAEAERVRDLRHVAGCGACRRELDLVRSVVAAGRRFERPRLPLAVAASVALLIGAVAVWRGVIQPNRGSEVPRSGPTEVILVAPVGDLHGLAPRALVWRAVPGGVRYQVELLDVGGNLLFSLSTSDTIAALPRSLSLTPSVDYRWWVLVTYRDATQTRSFAERFRIQP